MATINVESAANAVGAIEDVAERIPWFIAAFSAIPVLMVLMKALVPTLSPYGNMSEGEAVTVYSVLGGATGVATQWVISQNFKTVTDQRGLHILELIPSIVLSLVASTFISWALTPPNGTLGVTTALKEAGKLPETTP